jgi:dephospho-CoA kinase
MKKVGITGGIGSGKSIVCNIFRLLGIPVYPADAHAKRLMEESPDLRASLVKAFGEKTYKSDNSLDRQYMAGIVFNDVEKLEQLNQLVHPAVVEDYARWVQQFPEAPYTIREAAILFESGTWKDLDAILLVDAPEEMRIKRVMSRDGRKEAEVRAIISRQWTSEKKKEYANYIIENDEAHMVIPRVLEIHQLLKQQ